MVKDITKGEKEKQFQIPLSGKWKPVFTGPQLKEGDFKALTNMRYTDSLSIKSILGMSKVNPDAITSSIW
jgi:hypothetical protein